MSNPVLNVELRKNLNLVSAMSWVGRAILVECVERKHIVRGSIL